MTAPTLWRDLRRFTPARVALGRVGNGLPTAAHLDFQAAHAAARDAVHAPLDIPRLQADLAAVGLASTVVRSACPDRATYLLRPDLGRRLADGADLPPPSDMAPPGMPTPGTPTPGTPTPGTPTPGTPTPATPTPAAPTPATPTRGTLAIVLCDGLSATAVQRHAVTMLARLEAEVPRLGPIVIAAQGRVALGDEIGAALHAEAVAVLIGERPGLSSADSLGAYLTWQPRRGRTDAERNCISNIRQGGLSPEEAAAKLAWLVGRMRALGLSGVGLKDEQPRLDQDRSTSVVST